MRYSEWNQTFDKAQQQQQFRRAVVEAAHLDGGVRRSGWPADVRGAGGRRAARR
jgi:hypothetical protein